MPSPIRVLVKNPLFSGAFASTSGVLLAMLLGYYTNRQYKMGGEQCDFCATESLSKTTPDDASGNQKVWG